MTETEEDQRTKHENLIDRVGPVERVGPRVSNASLDLQQLLAVMSTETLGP